MSKITTERTRASMKMARTYAARFVRKFACAGFVLGVTSAVGPDTGMAADPSTSTTSAPEVVEFEVAIEEIRAVKGTIRVAVFDADEGFPGDSERAILREIWAVTDTTVLHKIRVPANREIAISIMHDEDSDGKLKTGIFGIPREGVGSSNNPKTRFGPPTYEDSKFRPRPGERKAIRVTYL